MPRFTFALRLSFISVALCRVAIGNIGGAADVAEEAPPAVLGRNGRVHTAVPAIHRHARAGAAQYTEVGRGSKPARWIDRPAVKSTLLVVAGGLSGAVAKTVTAPLERVKLLAQAGTQGGMTKLLGDVVAAEGLAGLWRGNPANVLRVIPNKGILLMCSDMYKAGVAAALPMTGAATVAAVAGALAGFTSVGLTYPLERVRMLMSFQICTDGACKVYDSILGTFVDVVKRQGPLGLYSGVGATVIGALPFEGIKFGANDFFKTLVPKGDDGRSAPLWSLCTGAAAGTLAHMLTYPLDTVRRRMQISGVRRPPARPPARRPRLCALVLSRRPRSQAQGAVRYANMVQCAGSILTQEGVGAFFLGIQPTLIRSVPNLGIQFLLYELLKRSIGF